MRSLLIVMFTELCQLLPRVVQRREPLHVQTLVPQSTVETLDESVLHWTTWPNETQLYVVGHCPSFQRPTRKLAPIVHRDALWQTTSFLPRTFQRLRHFHPRHGAICFQPHTLPCELVHHRQNAKRTSVG